MEKFGTDGKPLRRIIIDHIHFWAPITKNQPIQEKSVEDYVLDLHRKFRFRQVSIDQWNSQSSVIKLRSLGVPIIEKQFNKNYKESIYTELSLLLREDRIDIYDISGGTFKDQNGREFPLNEIQEAKIQFQFLQKKWKGKRFVIEAMTGYKDDLCDAIAAVAYETLFNKIADILPRSRTINLGGRIK